MMTIDSTLQTLAKPGILDTYLLGINRRGELQLTEKEKASSINSDPVAVAQAVNQAVQSFDFTPIALTLDFDTLVANIVEISNETLCPPLQARQSFGSAIHHLRIVQPFWITKFAYKVVLPRLSGLFPSVFLTTTTHQTDSGLQKPVRDPLTVASENLSIGAVDDVRSQFVEIENELSAVESILNELQAIPNASNGDKRKGQWEKLEALQGAKLITEVEANAFLNLTRDEKLTIVNRIMIDHPSITQKTRSALLRLREQIFLEKEVDERALHCGLENALGALFSLPSPFAKHGSIERFSSLSRLEQMEFLCGLLSCLSRLKLEDEPFYWRTILRAASIVALLDLKEEKANRYVRAY